MLSDDVNMIRSSITCLTRCHTQRRRPPLAPLQCVITTTTTLTQTTLRNRTSCDIGLRMARKSMEAYMERERVRYKTVCMCWFSTEGAGFGSRGVRGVVQPRKERVPTLPRSHGLLPSLCPRRTPPHVHFASPAWSSSLTSPRCSHYSPGFRSGPGPCH